MEGCVYKNYRNLLPKIVEELQNMNSASNSARRRKYANELNQLEITSSDHEAVTYSDTPDSDQEDNIFRSRRNRKIKNQELSSSTSLKEGIRLLRERRQAQAEYDSLGTYLGRRNRPSKGSSKIQTLEGGL